MITSSFHYINGPVRSSFNFYDYVNSDKVIPDQFLMQNTWVVRDEGYVTHYPIDEAFAAYKKQYGIDADAAFSELKRMSDRIVKSFVVAFVGHAFNETYQNGSVHKHFHPPATDKNNVYQAPGYRRTITAVIPTKIVDPVTEKVCMQTFDYDFVGKAPVYNSYQDSEWQEQNLSPSPEITRIDMPGPGQYLMLDFTSSHTLHWVENSQNTKNEYIFLVQDI